MNTDTKVDMSKGAKIGWDGTTVRDMLHESERVIEETGYYAGLENLPLKESDPIRFEKLYARLRGGIVDARETAMQLAASPLVREMGEVCFAVYTPEGDSVALSTGIIVHVHTMSEGIKYMVRKDYESNPGIRDRDIFVNNDPLVSNVHNADIHTFVPVFWEGELVAWVAGVTHEYDYGAKTPGGAPVGPLNRYEDGIILHARRCGEEDTLYQDYVEFCKNSVRTPFLWTLDEKTRITGCHRIRDVVLDLIRSEGVDTYKQLVREAVEEGRRGTLQRVRSQLVPGTYRSPAFVDYQFEGERQLPEEAAVDAAIHAPVTTTVHANGTLEVSLEGANKWGMHSFNCTPSGMWGGLWAVLAETLMANDRMNDGAFFACELDLPYGSWANPDNKMTSHSEAWLILVPAFLSVCRALARAQYSRGYLEEVIAGWSDGTYVGGTAPGLPNESVVSNMEPCATGGGATVARDGIDAASCCWTPTSDMGEIEDLESFEPLLYLGRAMKPNSAGAGRRRGGSGYDCLRMVWEDEYLLQSVSEGAMFCHAGVFGGYPAAAGYRHTVRDTNLLELFAEQAPYPINDHEPGESAMSLVKGEQTLDKRATTMLQKFKRHDLFLYNIKGGPGLGDPLERESEDVQKDLEEGVLSVPFAKQVYGAVLTREDDGFTVDAEQTATRREEVKAERVKRAVPTREWIEKEKVRVEKSDFIKPVTDMYRSSFEVSPDWANEFRQFWNLSEDFSF
ncbi:MAG: N-methylhydantoinase [Solirubrobacterales bacterium]|nr:N-methylhydantoinase [Solirubrobacterales bacterium]